MDPGGSPQVGRRRAIALPLLGALAACGHLPRDAAVPMPLLADAAVPGRRASLLVVMLPGAYSRPGDFIREGFVHALRRQQFDADLLLADSHIGYARSDTLLDRLHDDVLVPARQRGYGRIWLVGISLGGFASLGLLRRDGEMIDGVVAIAPYLGRPALLQQVAAAGGAAAFAAGARDQDDLEVGLWLWLARADAALRDKLHLYTGSDDRFIEGHRLLAPLLASDHVAEAPGGHDWPAWRALWLHWLARSPWPQLGDATLAQD